MITVVAMGSESLIFANEEDSVQVANIENNAITVTPDEAFITTWGDSSKIIDYLPEKNPLHPKVVIPSTINGTPVTTIAGSACDAKGIEELVLPENLQTIEEKAFKDNKIKSIQFPKSLTYIMEEAFGNNDLTRVDIHKELVFAPSSLGPFYGCTNLKEVYLEEGITNVYESAFENSGVETIHFPSTLKTIERYAFSANKIKNISFPATLEKIEYAAFNRNQIEEIVLPDSVTEIGSNAFEENKINKLILSNSLTTIPQQCFNKNELKEVIIPNSVTTIGQFAFMNNTIEKLTLGNKVNEIVMGAFADGNRIKSLILPSSITKIGYASFNGNAMQNIVLPNSITSMGTDVFTDQEMIADYKKSDGKYYFYLDKDMDYTKVSITSEYEALDTKTGKVTFASAPATLTYDLDINNSTINDVMKVKINFNLQNECLVQFKDDNGILLQKEAILAGESATAPDVSPKAGYTFIGWDKPLTNITLDTVFTAQYKLLPTDHTENVTIEYNAEFDPISYIHVLDADGNQVTKLEILSNDVNTKKAGSYTVEYKATDAWDGIKTGKYTVTVEKEKWYQKEMTDEKTGLIVSGSFRLNSTLIIQLTPSIDNPLIEELKDNHVVLSSYEIKIIGDYQGKLKIVFPIAKEHEGKKIYIQHLKKDGSIDNYTEITKNSTVSIEVDELSPFLLTMDKEKVNEDEIIPSNPNISNNSNKEVSTGDSTSITMSFLALFISAFLIFISTKKILNK